MTTNILDVRNLDKQYGDFYALSDISMQVESGNVHGVIGPNGAGKTTFFNCLAGTNKATSGTILFEDQPIQDLHQFQRPAIGMGRSFQVTSLFADLSVMENLRLSSQALRRGKGFIFWRAVDHGDEDSSYARTILERVGLRGQDDTLAGALSHGQQRVLEVGMALMARPRLLLLDEPTSGMGIDDVPQMKELLLELRSECSILLIEHNIGLVSEVCDRVTVLQAGRVISEGSPEQVSQDEKVKLAYLGEGL